MGLDIYVGTLNRYYNGQWETAVQRLGREMGVPVIMIHTDPVHLEERADEAQTASIISSWMEIMRRSAAQSIGHDAAEWFDWKEDESLPYFTDKPNHDCFDALRQFAAHEEHPGRFRRIPFSNDVELDKSVLRSRSMKHKSRYSQFVNPIEIWIPSRFDIYFESERPSGGLCLFGSSTRLVEQLQDLNQRTWKLSFNDKDGSCETNAPIEQKAQYAWRMTIQLGMASVEHRLPMLLDY